MQTTLDAILTTPLEQALAQGDQQPFDVAVVGGGTCGLVASRTLLQAGHRVALIEAGPLVLLGNILATDLRYNATARTKIVAALTAQPRTSAGVNFGSLYYCLAGRGLFWTGASPRFDPQSFAGWPFSYEELEPYYEWAEGLFGVTTSLGSSALAQLLIRRLRLSGYQAEAGQMAVDRPELNNRLGGAVGNGLTPLLRSPQFAGVDGFAIVTNTFATRVEHDGARAVGVHVIDATGSEALLKAANVVIACGGFESVRLALASQIPDQSGTIGHGIADHIFVRGFFPLDPAYYDAQQAELAVVTVRANADRAFQIELHVPNDNIFGLEPATWNPMSTTDYSVMVRMFAPTQTRSDNRIELGDRQGRASFIVHFEYSAADQELISAMKTEMDVVRAALPANPAPISVINPVATLYTGSGISITAILDNETSFLINGGFLVPAAVAATTYGIYLQTFRGISIVGTQFFPTETLPMPPPNYETFGVCCAPNTFDVVVTGCQFNSQTYGVYCNGTVGITICANRFYSSIEHPPMGPSIGQIMSPAVACIGATNVSVTGNSFSASTSGGMASGILFDDGTTYSVATSNVFNSNVITTIYNVGTDNIVANNAG